MPKFKPSFGGPTSETTEEAEEEASPDPAKEKEEGYFKICQSMRFDGRYAIYVYFS